MAIAYSIPSVYECNSYIPMTWSLSFSYYGSLFANLKFLNALNDEQDNF